MNRGEVPEFSHFLKKMQRSGRTTALNAAFAAFVGRQMTMFDRLGALAALLISHSASQGGVCLNLAEAIDHPLLQASIKALKMPIPQVDDWIETLLQNPAVGRPGDRKPLVLDGQRLYLERFWRCEQRLAEAIHQRIQSAELRFEPQRIVSAMQQVFGKPSSGRPGADQCLAALAAIYHRFCVITGGPGTGKTHTILNLLALIQAVTGDHGLSFYLCAPTGKAVARMQAAVAEGLHRAPMTADLAPSLSGHIMTLHRLLQRGVPGSKLEADVIVVDEASMVDLSLMALFFERVRDQTRIILVGDKDQLASVQPGAVFGDICRTPYVGQFNPSFLHAVLPLMGEDPGTDRWPAVPGPALQDAIVNLRHSFRFDAGSGIGALARAIIGGHSGQVLGLLADAPDTSIGWLALTDATHLQTEIRKFAQGTIGRIWSCDTPQAALAQLARFRFLCVLRQGPYGVEALNQQVTQHLAAAGLVAQTGLQGERQWYHGRPVMITRNDHPLGLYNGDTGIAWRDPESNRSDGLSVYFEDPQHGLRSVDPAQVPAHETAFALTVHKSQGSEFSEVVLILPDREMPLLTRELIYTAVTRAKRRVTLWGRDQRLLAAAVKNRHQRQSGLGEVLWGD